MQLHAKQEQKMLEPISSYIPVRNSQTGSISVFKTNAEDGGVIYVFGRNGDAKVRHCASDFEAKCPPGTFSTLVAKLPDKITEQLAKELVKEYSVFAQNNPEKVHVEFLETA